MIRAMDQIRRLERSGKRVLVLYTVNCSSFVAISIAEHFQSEGKPVDVIGNESCYDNQDIIRRLLRFSTHPDVGAVLIVCHGCEFIQGTRIYEFARERGRQADIIFGQGLGTEKAIQKGIESVTRMLLHIEKNKEHLVNYGIPTIGLAAQSANLGQKTINALAQFVKDCEKEKIAVLYQPVNLSYSLAKSLSKNNMWSSELWELYEKSKYLAVNGNPCACNNALEVLNSALLPLAKGIVKIAQKPKTSGLWILDDYQDKDLYKGYPNASIASELLEFIACGSLCSVLISDRFIRLRTPIIPLIICSSSITSGQIESKESDAGLVLPAEDEQFPTVLLSKIEDVIAGKTIDNKMQFYSESMIFGNMQK